MLNCFVFHIMCYVNNVEVKTYDENLFFNVNVMCFILCILFSGEKPQMLACSIYVLDYVHNDTYL